MDLTNRVAVVTGSARGIGQAIALRLAEAGADVVVNDIEAATGSLDSVAAEIKAMNRRSLAVTADVSSPEDVTRLVEAANGTFGKVDILVNNAGVTRDQLVLRMSDEDWDTVMNIDLKSTFLCTRAVLRNMVKQRWGRIVSIASVIGLIGNAGQLGILFNLIDRGCRKLLQACRELLGIQPDHILHVKIIGIGHADRILAVPVFKVIITPGNPVVRHLFQTPGMQVALDFSGLGVHQ